MFSEKGDGKMKILLMGVSMFSTGFICSAIICDMAILATITKGSCYFMDILKLNGMTSMLYFFLAMGVIGFVISIVGLFFSNKESAK